MDVDGVKSQFWYFEIQPMQRFKNRETILFLANVFPITALNKHICRVEINMTKICNHIFPPSRW